MRIPLILSALLLSSVALAGDDPFMRALLSDFKQDGTVIAPAEIEALYKQACDSGNKLACDFETWHQPGGAALRAGAEGFAKACDGGDLTACVVSSWQLTQIEHGVPDRNAPDIEKGAAYLAKACEGGQQRACGEMSHMLRNGLGLQADASKAVSLATKACDSGDGQACRQMGITHRDGLVKDADASKAVDFFHKACEVGDMFGCWSAGKEGNKADGAKAVEHYQKACDAKVAEGCYHLAEIHREGALVKPDVEKAAELDRQACQGGEPLACERLGALYDEGRTVDASVAKAATLRGLACDAGLAKGCAEMARMLHHGRGVPEDRKGGIVLSSKACEAGIAWACGDLGMRWLRGEGTEAKDAAKAETLLLQSCEGGTAWACNQLSALYTKGELTPSKPYKEGVGAGKTSTILIDAKGIHLDGTLTRSWVVPGQARDADYLLLGVRLASGLMGKPGTVELRAAPGLRAEVWVPAVRAAADVGATVSFGPVDGALAGPIVRRPLDGTAVSLRVGPMGSNLLDHWEHVDNDAAVICTTIPCAGVDDYQVDRIKTVLAGVKEKRDAVTNVTLALEGTDISLAAGLVTALGTVWDTLSLSALDADEQVGERLPDELVAKIVGTGKGKWKAKGDAWWAYDQAKIKVRQEKWDAATKLYEDAVAKQSGCGECALSWGWMYKKQGNVLAFLQIVDQLIEKYPKEGEPISLRAYWYAEAGDLTRADEEATRAQALDKKDGTVQDVKGKIASKESEEPIPPPKFTILGSDEQAHERMPQSVSKRFDRVIQANQADLKACYNDAAANNAELEATVTFQLGIDSDGTVVHAAVRESNVENDGLHSCLLGAISEMSFPGSEGEGMETVAYTLVLLPR